MGDQIDFTCTEATKQSITFATASAIAEDVLKTDAAATRVVFNRFKSAIAFVPTVATVPSPETIEAEPALVEKFDEYELEGPDRSEFLTDLQEFNLATTIYMDMLNDLTIKYNKSRQASITTELIEIISGAVALE